MPDLDISELYLLEDHSAWLFEIKEVKNKAAARDIPSTASLSLISEVDEKVCLKAPLLKNKYNTISEKKSTPVISAGRG